MPLDHITSPVSKAALEPLVTYLATAHASLGLRELVRPVPHAVGLGETSPYLWVISDPTTEATDAQIREWRKQHVAFTVGSTLTHACMPTPTPTPTPILFCSGVLCRARGGSMVS
ncbi:hypothetical protein P171DRAFT_429051 [Karstenula rhodostoma CBS 690.94]|uniref:Uncharacterized protein n=1 Tax=Karstenula rhodostoma CBS 690.94 TaxID=1392251 RepID=A0A9P4PNN4_9PLEO|nr:hypothetical protein P171DRAFT_429051 [Karstenula rhodostoma CBS 690.94]